MMREKGAGWRHELGRGEAGSFLSDGRLGRKLGWNHFMEDLRCQLKKFTLH